MIFNNLLAFINNNPYAKRRPRRQAIEQKKFIIFAGQRGSKRLENTNQSLTARDCSSWRQASRVDHRVAQRADQLKLRKRPWRRQPHWSPGLVLNSIDLWTKRATHLKQRPAERNDSKLVWLIRRLSSLQEHPQSRICKFQRQTDRWRLWFPIAAGSTA